MSIFLSLAVIEVVVFIPSYFQRRADKLRELEAVSEEVLLTLKANVMTDMVSTQLLASAQANLSPDTIILGATLYDDQGEIVDTFGESPELTAPAGGIQDIQRLLSADRSRYDVAWPSRQFQERYVLIIRHDATSVQRYMVQYSIGIFGIVVLISAFVTLVTIVLLGRMVIHPLLLLRDDLCQAAGLVHQPNQAEFKSLKHAWRGEL
ncbi:MAG: adenylate/guanylate cyclase domain-containing protein, partial [Cyanobacteria bacterium J06642_11]